ncbi:MAG TPA: type II toxin-antitoxin system HicB family antitoxin [Terriglobia bacterium]|nr:type II toxin-antitoxin system HicB family antitoxin [Terriglobia bacterium]
MKTYSFKVVLERDEDFDGKPSGWRAYCPALERQGASTWGPTEKEALQKLNEVVRMVVDSMLEHGERLPEEPGHEVEVTVEPRVAVTV